MTTAALPLLNLVSLISDYMKKFTGKAKSFGSMYLIWVADLFWATVWIAVSDILPMVTTLACIAVRSASCEFADIKVWKSFFPTVKS